MAALLFMECGLLAVHLVHRVSQPGCKPREHVLNVGNIVFRGEGLVLLADGLVTLDQEQQFTGPGIAQLDASGDLSGAQGLHLVTVNFTSATRLQPGHDIEYFDFHLENVLAVRIHHWITVVACHYILHYIPEYSLHALEILDVKCPL